MNASLALFWTLAIISVGSAVAMVANKNPVRSALWLVANFMVLALFFFTLGAQFLGAVQVIVYAGAIMVLFLFTIMLLNLGSPVPMKEPGGLHAPVAIFLGVVFVTVLAVAGSTSAGLMASPATRATLDTGGSVETIGLALFDGAQPWLLPFELTSILLLVAVVGSIILAKRRI